MTSAMTALALIFSCQAAPLVLQSAPAQLDQSEIEDFAVPAAEVDGERVEAAPRAAPAALTQADKDAIVRDAAAALGSVETARGQFYQISPDGADATGDFALRRPGRMRFDYDDPSPLVIISDGATVAIEDRDLETVDRVPLISTPLGLVLDDNIDFETEAEVTDVRLSDGFVSISLRDRTGEAEGELTLVFSSPDYELIAWRTVDDAGGVTSVQLNEVETGVSLNPRIFRIEDPEDEDDRRR